MTDEEMMKTSEIMARLRHTSLAATRSWIRNHKLRAKGRDLETGEKTYHRRDVDEALARMPRGPYLRRNRPPVKGPRDDHDGVRDSD